LLAAYLGWSGNTVDADLARGHYLSGGVTWQIAPQLELDVGGRLGLSSGAPAYGLTAGLTTALVRR
jgi:long-subunit fatty acid transport protein